MSANVKEHWSVRHCLCLSALVGIALPFLSPTALAQSLPGGKQASLTNLDLSSSKANVIAPNSSPTTILAGGEIKNGRITGGANLLVSPGQLLTPAQYLAVSGAAGGQQTLQLNMAGQATGGYAVYSGHSAQLTSLIVPQNVSLNAIGFYSGNPLAVSGIANIYGSLFALQTASNLTAVLNVKDLSIFAGGLLSTSLPDGTNLGSGVFASNGLRINVLNNLTNLGTIASAGDLSIAAGGSITNQSSTNSLASLVAQNIALVTGSGEITNSGLIQAQRDININTIDPLTRLLINCSGGTMQALTGAIKIRDVLYDGSGDTILNGGNWLSPIMSINSGSGTVNANVGEISGVICTQAGAAHVLADTPTLSLGNTKIDGDPTFVNAGGDIAIVGTITENEDLAIVASGNIVAKGPAQIIDHGHNVWLIAGADIVTTNCTGCGNDSKGIQLPPGKAPEISSGYVQISASGAPGGDIDLQSQNTLPAGRTVIDTSNPNSGGAGGNVTLVALGNGAVGGSIMFPSSAKVASINSSGSSAGGANGNVTLYAGRDMSNNTFAGNAISLGDVIANRGTGGAATVSINTAQAAFGGGAGGCGACMSFDSAGVATGGVVSATPKILVNIELNGNINTPNPNGPTSASNNQITAAAVFVNGDIGSPDDTTSISATYGVIMGDGLITSRDLSLSANYGDIMHLNTAVNNSLTANVFKPSFGVDFSGAWIDISNTGDLTSFKANVNHSSGSITLVNKGNVTLGGDVWVTGHFNGFASIITITLDEGSTLTVGNGYKIGNSASVYINADHVALSGAKTINSAGAVFMNPVTPGTAINLGGGSGGLDLSISQLMSISAGTVLQIGSPYAGDMRLNSDLSLSPAPIAGLYMLGRSWDSTGTTITTGGKLFRVDVFGGTAVFGNVNGNYEVNTLPPPPPLDPGGGVTPPINSNSSNVISLPTETDSLPTFSNAPRIPNDFNLRNVVPELSAVALNLIDVNDANISNASSGVRNREFQNGRKLHNINGKGRHRALGQQGLPASLLARNRYENESQIYSNSNSKLSLDGQHLHLSEGEVFVSASKEMKLTTKSLEVLLSKGAVVSLCEDGSSSFVRACASGSVKVRAGGQLILLNPGEELLLTDKKVIFPLDGVARRNTRVSPLGPNNVAISDFSLMSLVSNDAHFPALDTSNNSDEKQLMNSVLKTAASIDVALKNRGAYMSNSKKP